MANKNWLIRLYDGVRGTEVNPRVIEKRTSLENPQTPLSYPAEWLLDIFNGGRTDSGIRVSEMTALQVGTVFACVNVISDGVSSLPLHVYQRATIAGRASKQLALDSPLYKLVHLEPNPEMSSAVYFKVAMAHALLWGNTYSELQRNNSGQVIAIWPRNPARTRPIRLLKPILFEGDMLPAGTMMYETSDQMMDSSSFVVDQNPEMMNVGLKRLVLMDNMIHVPGLSLDGRLGQSTVWLARQAFGLALATEKYGAKFFGNGARPAGILTLPNAMEDKAVDTLRRSWAEAHGGENQFKVAVLEQGVKYEKIAATPEEGQMLETRKYEREEICAIFGVPAHMVCAQEKGGKSNVEQSSIEFVLYCLHPWLNRIEQELERKLFSDMGRSAGKYFAKFDTRKLMYPDAAARSTFYSQGKQWGFLNTNMILELEDMNPIADTKVGETFWQPINMQDAGDPQKLGAADQNELDIQKATAVAEHGAQMEQNTAKVTTNLQMKTAQQAHEHSMEAMKEGNKHTMKEGNKHTQVMAKQGLTPSGNKPGSDNTPTPPAGDNTPAAAKAAKRFSNPSEMRAAMQQAMDDGFVFTTAVKDAEGTLYRYLNPDHRELYLRWMPMNYKPDQKPTPVSTSTADGSLASGSDRDNMMDLYAGDVGAMASKDPGAEVRGGTDYVMRHGDTKANDEDVYRGWGEYPIDAQGQADAEKAAEFLKDKGVKKIVTSSLARQKQTADIVSKVLNVPVETDEGFRTLNVGDFTGKRRSEHADRLQKYLDAPTVQIPGGETVQGFEDRSNAAFARARAAGGGTLIITSRSNIFALQGKSTGDEVKVTQPGGVYELTGDKDLKQIFGSSNTDTLAGS
jgi:HK97 family phage portal protein